MIKLKLMSLMLIILCCSFQVQASELFVPHQLTDKLGTLVAIEKAKGVNETQEIGESENSEMQEEPVESATQKRNNNLDKPSDWTDGNVMAYQSSAESENEPNSTVTVLFIILGGLVLMIAGLVFAYYIRQLKDKKAQ